MTVAVIPDVAAPAVTYRGVSMQYAATRALCDADLSLAPGQVHAFVGENGAGKSTCLGVLAGRIAPTSGEVRIGDQEITYGDPRGCRRAGVVAIYQELTIVPALSAQANVFLGIPLRRRGFLREREMRRRYLQLCEEFGVPAVPDGVPAGQLSVAEQQLLEIMRALVADPRVILFDEPTASLALQERDALLRLMAQLRDGGLTLVFVSHNLDEVMRVADTITVFRDGSIVAAAPREDWDKRRLVHEMLGDGKSSRIEREFLDDDIAVDSPRKLARHTSGQPIVRVAELEVPGAVSGVSLEVHAGEILGLGGLVGSGRTTILRALAGLEPRATGRMWIDGQPHALPRTVRQARALGIALLPEDRKGQGLVLGMDAMNNIALSDLSAVARFGFLSRRVMSRRTAEAAESFGFRRERITETVRNLSGGNQQKLMLARWRFSPPRVLLADEPTRGIDIGAKAEIMTSLETMAADGLGIVLVSSELEEVCALSDRVLVLTDGRAAGLLDAGENQITPSRIMATAFELEEATVVS
jgi:ABC-type sugar transport system ATPase subunit